ncbi:uncharacterized protein ASPGLDRAFT_61989 [Aspergillus glaucus CBS 516.65]|uniref:Uncharacterized protein n=1 Tax=Aspergillus glaucus CBS 516.65 TaxID=1160497 RepID=A0A1L9V5Q1_ASPGL|nr:hypothetical protein ASPGLDRAFT_61989 [Aspergillus glaucus CBS 516.65]OJJ79253.1 hypothetical protein ASPGLDRAFT_61989 [Aspergillus glaucus CBS 516.65]
MLLLLYLVHVLQLRVFHLNFTTFSFIKMGDLDKWQAIWPQFIENVQLILAYSGDGLSDADRYDWFRDYDSREGHHSYRYRDCVSYSYDSDDSDDSDDNEPPSFVAYVDEGISINGIGDDAHEPFTWYPDRDHGGIKTAHKPYDDVVTCIMLIAYMLMPDAFEIRSNGDRGDWKPGLVCLNQHRRQFWAYKPS